MKKTLLVLIVFLLVFTAYSVNLTVIIPDNYISRIKEALTAELKEQGIENPTNAQVAEAIKEFWKNELKKKVLKYEKKKAEKEAIDNLQPLNLDE